VLQTPQRARIVQSMPGAVPDGIHHPSRRGCAGPNLTDTQVTPGNRPGRRTATRMEGCRDSGKDSRQPAAVKGGPQRKLMGERAVRMQRR
jgi:hypothetical protein